LALAIEASKSLAKRRFRLSQAKVRSTPIAGEQLKSGRVSGAFDNLDGPVAEFGQGVAQVWAIVDAVGKEMTQPGK
jgi:hypothetical protein